MSEKTIFAKKLEGLVNSLKNHVSAVDGQWTVKGFIDLFKNVYTISSDTKIVSKILEIHLFPKILKFAQDNGYKVVLAEHQNYYPDISFVKTADESVRLQLISKPPIATLESRIYAMASPLALMANTSRTGQAQRISNSLTALILDIFV